MMILILLILLSFNAYAEEVYLVDKPNNSVAIAKYLPGSEDTLEEFLKDSGLGGLTYVKADESSIPENQEDRKYWIREGNKIVIDEEKKQHDEEEKVLEISEEEDLREKLKTLGFSDKQIEILVR